MKNRMIRLLSLMLVSLLTTMPVCGASAEPYTLEPSGKYILYAYGGALQGYTSMGYAYWRSQGESQPELEAAIDALNALPKLALLDTKPTGEPQYGLMTVDTDTQAKKQFFLYDGALTVNGTPYKISTEQYNKLKTVMQAGANMGGMVPKWLVYMNPQRVTKIAVFSDNKLRNMKQSNVLTAANHLRTIHIKSAKTYKPGSVDLDNLPFRMTVTFDSKVTYTLWISSVKDRATDVKIYLESSDMRYGCEYVVDGYISDFAENVVEMIDGPVNPPTGVA